MSDDDYPRVWPTGNRSLDITEAGFIPGERGPGKVVPSDAIVIERLRTPLVERLGDGRFRTTVCGDVIVTQHGDVAETLRAYAATYAALAEAIEGAS